MWDAFLDLALGSTCVVCGAPGRVLCRPCAQLLPTSGIRVRPDPEPDGLAPSFAVGPYADPLRQMILAHKERGVLALAGPLGGLLAVAVTATLEPCEVLLVPVPSSARTVRRRGHDPVARMVRVACRRLVASGYRASPAGLLRPFRPTADQADLGAGDRLANLDGSFALDTRTQHRLAGRRAAVVVCDDVITTGATAREAQRALSAVGVEVAGIAAVAATRRRRPSDRATGPPPSGSLPICSREG